MATACSAAEKQYRRGCTNDRRGGGNGGGEKRWRVGGQQVMTFKIAPPERKNFTAKEGALDRKGSHAQSWGVKPT